MVGKHYTATPVAKKSHKARRIGIVLAAAGLSLGAMTPMANAFFLPGDGGPNNENCGEYGTDLLDLDPAVSGLVHYAVEPLLGEVDGGLYVPEGQGLEGAVHAVDCTVVVPLEGAIDDIADETGLDYVVGGAEWVLEEVGEEVVEDFIIDDVVEEILEDADDIPGFVAFNAFLVYGFAEGIFLP